MPHTLSVRIKFIVIGTAKEAIKQLKMIFNKGTWKWFLIREYTVGTFPVDLQIFAKLDNVFFEMSCSQILLEL